MPHYMAPSQNYSREYMTLAKAMSTHTSFHEGLHLCWGFLTLNSLYSLTNPSSFTASPDRLLRVLYFPQRHHFLSTVAEGDIIPWQDFVPFLFNKHTKPTKWSNKMRITVTLEPLFLQFSSSILRCLLLFWLLYTLKMSKYHHAKDFQLSLCARRVKPRLISKLNRGLKARMFTLTTSQHNHATWFYHRKSFQPQSPFLPFWTPQHHLPKYMDFNPNNKHHSDFWSPRPYPCHNCASWEPLSNFTCFALLVPTPPCLGPLQGGNCERAFWGGQSLSENQ